MYSEKPSLFGMLYQPTLQFQRLNERPTFGLALVLNSLLTATFTALMVFVISTTNKAMLKEILQIVGISIDYYSSSQDAILIYIFLILLIRIPLLNLIGAFFCWIFVLIFGGETTFRKIFAVNVNTGFISVINVVISSILTMLYPEFMDSAIEDIFILLSLIWQNILLAIGLQKTTTLSKGKAVAIVIILLAISFTIDIILALSAIK